MAKELTQDRQVAGSNPGSDSYLLPPPFSLRVVGSISSPSDETKKTSGGTKKQSACELEAYTC